MRDHSAHLRGEAVETQRAWVLVHSPPAGGGTATTLCVSGFKASANFPVSFSLSHFEEGEEGDKSHTYAL